MVDVFIFLIKNDIPKSLTLHLVNI